MKHGPRTSRLALAGLTAGALLLAACGGDDGGSNEGSNGGNGSNGETGNSAESGGTLKFYTERGGWKAQFEEVGRASEEEINVGLEVVDYREMDLYTSVIKQAFRTNEKPTLFTWNTGSRLAELVDEGVVAPTSQLWQDAIGRGDIPADLEQYYTINGEQYCVPMNIAYWVLYYNKHIFDEHGLTPPETWADLIDIADTLVANDVVPFYQTDVLFSFVWFQTLLAGSDPDLYVGLSTGEASYTDPGVVAVMEQWRDMMEKGYFNEAGITTEPDSMLNNQEVAMLNFGTFFTGSLNDLGMVSGEDYDFFIIPNVNPALDRNVLLVESGPLCAAEEADDRELAMEYLDWWVSPSAQTAWSNARGDVSFNPSAEVQDERLADLGAEVGTNNYQLIERYFEAAPAPVLTAALDGFGAFVVNPGDPIPILEMIQAEADAFWADQQ
jgi:multiple sugar transport system substrate-binding protein